MAALVRADLEVGGKTGWITVKMGKGKKTRRVPVNEKSVEVLKEYAAEAGVEHVSPHSFRHTVDTRLVRNPQIDLRIRCR